MTEIIGLFIAILTVSFTCSLLEAILLSVNASYVAVLVKSKRRAGLILERLTDKVDRPISAVLTLNTLSHTLGASAMAFKVQHEFGDAGVTTASVILTVAILFFSEIIPKSIGAAYWKQLAPFAAYVAQILILLMYPSVVLTEWISKAIRPEFEAPEVTREEMIMTAEIGVEEGTIKNKESSIIKNLLMMDKIFVADIMTPRSVFFALEAEDTVEAVAIKYKPVRFSRIPVYSGSLDQIVGMTLRYKILEALSNDHHDTKIEQLLIPISSLPEKMTVSQVLDFFIKEKEHLALAVDEYGVTTGLVTLEDAVETLLGVEIVDEFDSVEDMRKYALEQWQQRKQKLRRS